MTEGEDQILDETGATDSGEQTGADSYNEDWEAEPQYDESVTYGDGTEIYDDETGSYEDGSGTYDDGSENYDGTGTYDDGSGMGY